MAHPGLATAIAAALPCGACAMPQQAEIYRYQRSLQGRRGWSPEGGWLDTRTITAERLRAAGFEF